MINKLRKKNLELLVLLSTAIGFATSFEVGFLFGISKETDLYLSSIILINFLSIISQISWETINIDYIGKCRDRKNSLFSTHLFSTLVISAILCLIYYYFDNVLLKFIGLESFSPSKVMITFFLFFYCFFSFLKRVIFCEESLIWFYLIDFIYHSIVFILIAICFYFDVNVLMANVISSFVCLTILMIVLHSKYSIRLSSFDVWCFRNGINGSLKLKVGAIFYSMKDVLIPALFMKYDEGMYTIYNYLSKILTSLFSILVLPRVNLFAIESLKKIQLKPKEVFKDAITLSCKYFIIYLISSLFVITPFLIVITNFVDVDFRFVVFISLCVIAYNAIICIEQFYARLVYNFECFSFIFLVNVIFGSTVYCVVKILDISVSVGLGLIITLQLLNLILYYVKARFKSEKFFVCN